MSTFKQRMQSIDSLRGIGCLFVVFCHVYGYEVLDPEVRRHFHMGGWVVQFFFCASGYLLFSNLTIRSQKEIAPLKNFYIRRFFRIVPLWWFTIIAAYFLAGFSAKVLFTNMFFLFGFLSYDITYLPIQPAWSLFVEEVFYIVFPFLFVPLSTKKWAPWVFLVLTIIVSQVWLRNAASIGVPYTNSFIIRFPFAHLQYFAIGIIFYYIAINERFMDLCRKINRFLFIPLIDVLCTVSYIAYIGVCALPAEFLIIFFSFTALLPYSLISWITGNAFLRWVGVSSLRSLSGPIRIS